MLLSYHIYKTWGRNSHSDHEYDLAPNITNTADASQVKWKEFLNESSPIVYFNYPKAALEFDKEKFVLRGKYQSQFDREKILITMGPGYESNNIIKFIEGVVVNGSDEEFFVYKKGKQFFVELINCPLKRGQEINLELSIRDTLETRLWEQYLVYQTQNYHFVTMPSIDFTGRTSEVGIFQGSRVDLYKTFRSSYNNIMISHNPLEDFDPWQEHSYGLLIDQYLHGSPDVIGYRLQRGSVSGLEFR